jgi:hypothetical protein
MIKVYSILVDSIAEKNLKLMKYSRVEIKEDSYKIVEYRSF